MAEKSLTLAAFFSRRSRNKDTPLPQGLPPRPEGQVVWVRALRADQIGALNNLQDQLQVDGDAIRLIVTFPYAVGDFAKSPVGKAAVSRFLDHWQPDLVLWIEEDLDPTTFYELAQRSIPCMLIGATKQALRPVAKGWVPGVGRAMLKQCVAIMTQDESVAASLIRAGAGRDKVQALGPLEGAPTPLPHFEDERHDMAKCIGARTAWLAAAVPMVEIENLAEAHQIASRRAHRLLLIVALNNADRGVQAAERLRTAGLNVALRSADEEPSDATQVYVADTEGELGLWYRIAPITYLGGSLSGGPCRDPFEPATLGSAVLHGPDVGPHASQIARLAAADACVTVDSFDMLGKTVERLLSPDKTAQLVHAAWDVTSRGADMTNRLAETIVTELDRVGG